MALQFLLLEDNPLDANTIQVTLHNGGIDCELLRVETRSNFITALSTNVFDLILADYALSEFDGLSALEIARNKSPEVPFIFVSSNLGEELAMPLATIEDGIAALKSGATDYVLKQRLGRLVSCVQRALQEAQERQRAEVALRESATKYRMLLESIDEGFCICEMLFDENGKPIDYRFLEVNSVFEGLTGLGQVVGKTVREIVPNLEAYWFDMYGKVVQTRVPVRFEQQAIAMNRWFDVNAFCIGEPRNNQFAILFTNITEAKRVEEKRKKVEQERERFLAVGSDLQVITSIDGYFQWVSPTFERTLGWRLDEMISRPWTDFVHPDDIPKSVSETDSLFSGNETIAFENRYRHKDGSYRWLLWNAQPYPEEQLIYGAAVDISSRKRTELNTEFFANVSQELVGATNIDEIVQTVGEQLNRYLNTSMCAFVEINQGARQAVINYDWHQNHVPSLVGVYSLREFVTDEFLQIAQSGQPIVVRDITVDPRIADPQRYAALKIGAEMNIPLIKDGEWKFSFTVFHQAPYNWREDEIELMRELANRIWVSLERTRAKAALRESRAELERQLQKFDVTLSTITDLVFNFDRDGRVVYANQVLLDLWGVTAEDAIGKTLAELNYPLSVEQQVMENTLRVFETGESVRDETFYTNPAGEYGYFEYILNPVFAADGTVKLVVGSSRNIIDRKQAELALRSSEEQSRNIVESITDAFFAVDEDWRFTYVNQTAAVLVNRASGDLIGKIFWEEFPGVNDSEFEKMHRRVMRSSVAESLTAFYPDHNRWYEVRSYPAANGITMYFRNVTDRIQALSALRQTSAELERQLQKFNAVSAVPDFIYMFDLSGRFIDVNKPLLDLWQKTLAEAIGKNFFELDYPVDLAAKLHLQIQEVIGTRQPLKDETPFTSAFGARAYEYIFVPIFDAEGAVEMVAGVTRDITERKQAEAEREKLLQQEQAAREAAEQANRIKDEFLAVLSHELRSPLNPILGWTKLLQNRKLDAPRQAEALATIERNAKLQAQLIEDLLDISRIMRGKLSLNATRVSLTFVIDAAVETVRLAAEAKNIQIALGLDSAIPSISGDAARLQQVVWNLLTNAVKFTPHGGKVTVELRQIEALAQIRVIDTGKGISPQFLPYVFEYFRQEDSSTTRKFGGLGLGLAIVRQIVEMHGGTVRAESRGENQGATFIVQLPVMQQPAPYVREPTHPQADPETPLDNVQILIVDDDTDTREFQAFLLEQNGAKVTAVTSGFEALQALNRFIPDVLVSDVGMAEMDGYMLMQEIRSRPADRGGTIPAIALTAYAGEIDEKQAILAGFQRHMPKPVDPANLVEAIVSLVARF